ncbi:hypothetical protein D3C78_1594670 [compost metagenome]
MTSTSRYSFARWTWAQVLRLCAVTSSRVSTTNLMPGTAMLAMKIIRAMSQAPLCQNSMTPLMMVLSAPSPSIWVFMTGSRLAGM